MDLIKDSYQIMKESYQIVSTLQDLIQSSSKDISTEKYISPVILRKIYRITCKLSELRLQRRKEYWKDTLKLERCLIHFLLERCYWMRYGDSSIVSDLLKKLFEVDGHLGKILDFQQLCTQSLETTEGTCEFYKTTWNEETLLNEEMQPYHYFLEHSYKMKTLFGNARLAEKYFVQCYINRPSLLFQYPLRLPPCSRTFIVPDILVTLLKYGLFANCDTQKNIEKLLTGVIGVILNSNPNSSAQDDYTTRIIEVGNTLLRAVSSVSISSLFQDQKLEYKQQTWRIVQQMSAPSLLPKLMLRCTGPQELQHICRRVIRRVLYHNWLLPQGITFLPLPALMKEYINLKFDF